MPQKYGERWFFHLIPSARSQGGSLMEKLSVEELEGKFIISQMVQGRDRWFPMFAAVSDPYELVNRTPEEERTFSEVIPGNEKQKPHFDIDGPRELHEELREAITEALQSFAEEAIHGEVNFYLFDMSDQRKTSLHAIASHVYVNNNLSAKRLMREIQRRMPSDLGRYLDDRVYISWQHFRLPGCHKEGTKRVKDMPETKEEFMDQMITTVYEDDELIDI